MNRYIAYFTVLILVLLFPMPVASQMEQGNSSSGVSSDVIYPEPYPQPNTTPGFLGQNHSYSVVFRGNGEAVVNLKVVLRNSGESNLSEIELRVPKIDPKDIFAFQVIKDQVCVKYKNFEIDPVTGVQKRLAIPVCEQYQENYFSGYSSNTKYQKAELSYEGDTLTITLPQPIPPEASGSYFVNLRAFGYAKKNLFGAYNYTFETFKVNEAINSLQVGIGTDSDLYLKNAKGEVDYRFEAPAMQDLSTGASFGAVKNTAIDSYYNQIGRGKITKTASNLSSLESYKVTGAYAKSVVRLYGKEIAITIVGLVVVVTLLLLAIRYFVRRLKKSAKETVVQDQVASTKKGVSSGTTFAVSAGISFAASVLIALYSIFLYVVIRNLSNVLGYQLSEIFALFFVVISFCVYASLLLGPAIYIGLKKGAGWGIAVLVMTIGWLFFFFLFALFVAFVFFSTPRSVITPLTF